MREYSAVLAILALAGSIAEAAQDGPRVINQLQARRFGMTRAWFSQVQLNPAYSHVSDWALSYDNLYVTTNVGLVHAFDVDTGRTLWATQVGNPQYPTLGPTVSDDYVAVINGSTAYLLNRSTGRIAFQQRLAGAAGAAPVFSAGYVYTPLISGRVIGYPLEDDPETFPFEYHSFGRATVRPVNTPNGLIWTTDDGFLYGSGSEGSRPAIQYRLQTPGSFTTSAKSGADGVYAVTSLGELYALNPSSGTQQWKYATGYPAYQAPAVIEGEIFVASVQPALHCVEAESGAARWVATGISRFAAATAEHVYGLDDYGTLSILDRESGGRIARFPTSSAITAVANDQSDRLILITETGLVQCLHELGAEEPQFYVRAPGAEERQPADEDAGQQAAEEASVAEEERPAPADDEAEAQEPEDPGFDDLEGFGEDDDQPDEEDNPFGIFGDEENPFE